MWAHQHQVLLERPCGAQWAGQWRPLLLLYSAQVSATEQPEVLYSNLQIMGENDRFPVLRVQLERAPPFEPC